MTKIIKLPTPQLMVNIYSPNPVWSQDPLHWVNNISYLVKAPGENRCLLYILALIFSSVVQCKRGF